MPASAAVVVQRQRLDAGLVEPGRVAEHVELPKGIQKREAHGRVLVDALAEQNIALGTPARVGFLDFFRALAGRKVLSHQSGERDRQEDAGAAKGLLSVAHDVVRVFGEGADVLGLGVVVGLELGDQSVQ